MKNQDSIIKTFKIIFLGKEAIIDFRENKDSIEVYANGWQLDLKDPLLQYLIAEGFTDFLEDV